MATTKKGARVNILNRLRGMPSFHPVTTDLFSDWRLEAGDVITVTKKEGENPITGEPIEVSYGVPIFQMDLNWNGAPVVEVRSTGSKKRPDPAKLNRGGGYGGSRQKEETEINVSRYHTEIIKTDQQITSLAYETGLLPGVKEIFNRNKDYKIGDYVLYTPGDGTPTMTYRFIAPHTAGDAWDPTEVEVVHTYETRITQNHDAIVSEVTRATGAETSIGTRVSQTESDIGLVVETKSGERVVKRSAIIAAINEDNESTVTIEADKIDINGIVTALSALDISVLDLTAADITADSIDIGAGGFTVDNEGTMSGGAATLTDVTCTTSLTVDQEYINVADVQVNGNTLEITYVDGTTDTFSKAITDWTGSWNGNVLTVTASPQNQSTTETMGIAISPTPSGGASSLTVDTFTAAHMAAINITASSITAAGGTYWKQFVIDASGVYTAGETAGGTAAGVTKGTWANGVLQVTRATSSSTKSTTITLSGGTPTWNGTTVSIPINDGQGPTYYTATASATAKLYALPTVTPSSSQQTFTAGSGDYANYIGFSSVTVGAASSYTEADVVNVVGNEIGTPTVSSNTWYSDITVTKKLPSTSSGTTETFQTSVQPAVVKGWDLAEDTVTPPSTKSITSGNSAFTFAAPSSTLGQSKTYNFTIEKYNRLWATVTDRTEATPRVVACAFIDTSSNPRSLAAVVHANNDRPGTLGIRIRYDDGTIATFTSYPKDPTSTDYWNVIV